MMDADHVFMEDADALDHKLAKSRDSDIKYLSQFIFSAQEGRESGVRFSVMGGLYCKECIPHPAVSSRTALISSGPTSMFLACSHATTSPEKMIG
jgi:hypothetical protein